MKTVSALADHSDASDNYVFSTGWTQTYGDGEPVSLISSNNSR